MSQASAARTTTRPATRPAARVAPQPPRLRVVAAPAQARSRAGLVVGCLGLLAAGLVGLLLLNVGLAHGTYQLLEQQRKENQLLEQREALHEKLASLEAPQNLAKSASLLGMIPAPRAAFLRTSDGSVLGAPAPASVASPAGTRASGTSKGGGRTSKATGRTSRGTP